MTENQNDKEANRKRAQSCNLGTETHCSICLGNFKSPKILPCTHNFCETPCLQNLLKSVSGNTFRCPLCRLEFPVPPTGTQAFGYNTNVEESVETHSPHAATDNTEIHTSLTQTVDIPLSCRSGNTRTPLVQETRFQSSTSQRDLLDAHHHATASVNRCLGISSCKDCILLMYYIAFIVYYVIVSFARIGIVIIFYCVTCEGIISISMVLIANYNQLRGIFDFSTAVATVARCRQKETSVAIFTLLNILCLFYGFVVIWNCADYADED